ncbi:MAG TPA: glycosyltransferase, partial [Verrucomicrobiales bacterium]|nr:glycosyltransferase [Verrucomicrobiales bacterium]
MPETEPQSTERPLVSFLLLAYNQEQYIHEAVEGAFSQTYSPLEIILSDDCSTDRTFEIMREMA